MFDTIFDTFDENDLLSILEGVDPPPREGRGASRCTYCAKNHVDGYCVRPRVRANHSGRVWCSACNKRHSALSPCKRLTGG